MPDGVKELWIWFCKQMSSSESNFVLSEEKLTLFLSIVFWTWWKIHIKFYVE